MAKDEEIEIVIQGLTWIFENKWNKIAERSDIIIRCSTLDVRCWTFIFKILRI